MTRFKSLRDEAVAIRRVLIPWIRNNAWGKHMKDVDLDAIDSRKDWSDWPWSHHIGHGADRIVFRSIIRPDVVLKVAYPGHEDSNLRELVVWENAGPKTRAALVPLVEAHPRGIYNAMPLVKLMPQGRKGFLQPPHQPKEQYQSLFKSLGAQDLYVPNFDIEGRMLDYGEWGLRPRGTLNQRRPGRFILTLKRGTLVYHGTGSDKEFKSLKSPAWVSRAKEVAAWFSQEWRDGKRPRILTFKVTRAMRLEVLEDMEHMEQIMEQLGDPMGTSSMAEAFCAARGVDGWIVRHSYGPGKDDILLCETGSLKYVGSEAVRHAR